MCVLHFSKSLKALKQMAKEVNFLMHKRNIQAIYSFYGMIKTLFNLVNYKIDYRFEKSMLSLLKLAVLVTSKEQCLLRLL